jgi:hypothetical protein
MVELLAERVSATPAMWILDAFARRIESINSSFASFRYATHSFLLSLIQGILTFGSIAATLSNKMIFIAPLSFILLSITTFIPAASSFPHPIEPRDNGLGTVVLPPWVTGETTSTRPWSFEDDTLRKRDDGLGLGTLPPDATKTTTTHRATSTHYAAFEKRNNGLGSVTVQPASATKA